MRNGAGLLFIGFAAAAAAGCGLDDFGTFDALDGGGAGPSSVAGGDASGDDDDATSSGASDAAAADAGDVRQVDASVVDGQTPVDAADAQLEELDADAGADTCVPPPVSWTWTCTGPENSQGIGAGSMCVEGLAGAGTTPSYVQGFPMPIECRQCMSDYTCACVLARFHETNACGTEADSATIAPASCTEGPDAGLFVVCPAPG